MKNILINLPPTFFTREDLKSQYDGLEAIANLRKRSHNTPEEIEEDLRWADAVIMWSWPDLTEALLDRVGELEFVGQINSSRLTAENCLKRGIALSEARHAWSPAVAEYALSLILSGLRRTSAFHHEMRVGSEFWVSDFPQDIDYRERELTGACVGLVGFGGIGRRLSQLLAHFAPELRVYDPYVADAVISEYGGQKTELDELLTKSEVIVTCAANAKDNEHMFGSREIALIQKDAVVVNVARSMLFDTAALLERARKGDITLMLDVFDQEPLEADNAFRKLDNVFCSPHRAGGIIPSVLRSLHALIEDFEASQKGEARRYAITEDMLVCLP